MSHSRFIPTILLLIPIFICTVKPAAAGECLDCHADIAKQLKGNSHHVQGVKVSGRHCYACHWEATVTGGIDEQFHNRDQAKIDLVLWTDGTRPEVYSTGSSAIIVSPAATGTDREREETAKISRHCLSCHNDRNNGTATFSGDTNTPGTFAWDGESIASRYSDPGVTTWGKYSTQTSNRKKQVVKAFSAHGNAVANKGGWSPSGGYDNLIPLTRGGSGTKNVQCYDCHNTHGSTISGITSSYRSANGSNSGGILKETTAGKSGYRMSYTPAANNDSRGRNPYNPGAGLCFDCHETAAPGTTPWGYNATFGASEPIMGYKDTHRFGPGVKGSTSRFTGRQGRSEIVSSHLRAGIFLNHSAMFPINGLCTPCHDPHGVSRSLGEKRPYAVPLLKGTWLTSPYREDAPPTTSPGKGGPARQGGGMSAPVTGTTRGPVSMQGMQYNVDRNTFGADGRINEGVEYFAGLCLKCHNQLKPSGESKTERIHRSVKGWGKNSEHAFPCSKCHQAHNSGLPRLMQTNCFEEGPAGLRDNIGLAWLPEQKGAAVQQKPGTRKTAANDSSSRTRKTGITGLVGCHVSQFGRSGATSRQGGGEWLEKTKW